jgi:hypothetical protein
MPAADTAVGPAVRVEALERACPERVGLATSVKAWPSKGIGWCPCRPVGPPTDADVNAVAESEAVRLFVEGAGWVDPDFELTDSNAPAVAQILPAPGRAALGHRVGRGRVGAMTPGELVRGLEHRFDTLAGGRRRAVQRHQTLRAAIDRSYRLCSQERGGCWPAWPCSPGTVPKRRPKNCAAPTNRRSSSWPTPHSQKLAQRWRALNCCHRRPGPGRGGGQAGHVPLLARAAHPLLAQGQTSHLRVVRVAGLAGARGPGPGRAAGRAGRPGRRLRLPGLQASERGRFAALVAEHGVEVPGGVRLPAGLAEVEVGYLEPLPTGRLREPVARAVRASDRS